MVGRAALEDAGARVRVRRFSGCEVNAISWERTTALVLAAGLSRRFGAGDKLLAPIGGRPLCMHVAATLAGLPLAARLAVCGSSEVAELFAGAGFEVVFNPDPAAGQGQSLRLGIEALGGDGAALLCLADMPFVSRAHLDRLARVYGSGGVEAVATTSDGYRGPPAIFDIGTLRRFRPQADAGARELLADAALVEAPAGECLDFDTPAAFAAFSDGPAP